MKPFAYTLTEPAGWLFAAIYMRGEPRRVVDSRSLFA
jgi:hypothetical protein